MTRQHHARHSKSLNSLLKVSGDVSRDHHYLHSQMSVPMSEENGVSGYHTKNNRGLQRCLVDAIISLGIATVIGAGDGGKVSQRCRRNPADLG